MHAIFGHHARMMQVPQVRMNGEILAIIGELNDFRADKLFVGKAPKTLFWTLSQLILVKLGERDAHSPVRTS